MLALPSVAGDVHDVIVMDDILCFASGPACWMYGNGGDGFSWREQPDYYVAAYLIHPLVERCQLVERCLVLLDLLFVGHTGFACRSLQGRLYVRLLVIAQAIQSRSKIGKTIYAEEL